jgi:hypothetical protein
MSIDLDQSQDKMKMREEALRRKEKENSKKEEQMKDQLDQIRNMRSAMDATMQELEARELVMTDAESKHGSLLQREEAITRRERDVDAKEETLRERLIEATKRDQEAADFFKQRQREYEEKLFPLAAREQELVRREMEAHAMNHDLEVKYKQLNKHVAAEEEKEKVRDKAFRDREQALRDQMGQTERRQQELEQLNQHLTEKQRLLKAEHVENDGRDREIKWREEQLRIAQAEMTELKTKLIKWEGKLAVDEEANRVEQSRVSMRQAELALRETEIAEKTNKLLAMDEDIQRREDLSKRTLESVNASLLSSERQRAEVEDAKRSIQTTQSDLAARESGIRDKEARLNEVEQRLRLQTKALDEKESAIKSWIMELQYREQSSSAAATSTKFQPGELANAPLEAIQERYITMMGGGAGAASSAAGKKGAPPARGSASRMLLQPLGGASGGRHTTSTPTTATPGATMEPLGDAAESVAQEVRRCQLEDMVEQYMIMLYAMSDSDRKKLLSPSDELHITTMEHRNRELVSELQFLWLTLVGKQQPKAAVTSSSAKLTRELASFGYQFSQSDWASYYQTLRSEAVRRRNDVVCESIAKLTELLSILRDRVGEETLLSVKAARDELKNSSGISKIRRSELGKSLPVGRATNATALLAPLRSVQGEHQPAAANDEANSDDDEVSGDSDSQKKKKKPTASLASAAKSNEMRAQLISSLPEYLRHHYDE